VSVDVDSVRVASAVSEVSEGPAELKGTRMIATIEVSGAADDVLVAAFWTTFVVDFAGIPWDEVEGFDVSVS
jgi:hypothetical protein